METEREKWNAKQLEYARKDAAFFGSARLGVCERPGCTCKGGARHYVLSPDSSEGERLIATIFSGKPRDLDA